MAFYILTPKHSMSEHEVFVVVSFDSSLWYFSVQYRVFLINVSFCNTFLKELLIIISMGLFMDVFHFLYNALKIR